jgi:hypothetical protein
LRRISHVPSTGKCGRAPSNCFPGHPGRARLKIWGSACRAIQKCAGSPNSSNLWRRSPRSSHAAAQLRRIAGHDKKGKNVSELAPPRLLRRDRRHDVARVLFDFGRF